MNKRVKNILISVIVISILAIIILIAKISSRLPENPVEYSGNTAGNLYNRGLFVENENYIYFANPADHFRLYRTTHSLEDVIRLSTDSVEYLNLDFASDYLYYSRINYRQNISNDTSFDFLNTGIYRFHLKKKGLTLLYPKACGMVLLGGNNLYFQTHGDDGNFDLYSLPITIEKGDTRLITTDYIQPASYQNGLLYYSGVTEDHCLYSLSPDTNASVRLADLDCFQPIVTQNGTYFLSLKHNYSLFYLPNATDNATLITNKRIATYNLSTDGRYLFYQSDGNKSNHLYRYDLTTKQEKEIMNGNYKNLNTASGYLFFTDFEERFCYCYDISADSLFSFMPSAEGE